MTIVASWILRETTHPVLEGRFELGLGAGLNPGDARNKDGLTCQGQKSKEKTRSTLEKEPYQHEKEGNMLHEEKGQMPQGSL